jgi:hypothetical protein
MREKSSQEMMQLCAQTMTLHIVKNEAKAIIDCVRSKSHI